MLLVFLSVITLAGDGQAADNPSAEVRPFHSLHLETPYTPSISRIDGGDRLVYELHATNFSSRTLAIASLELRDERSGALVAAVDLDGSMRRIGPQDGAARSLAPGQRGIFYLSLPWTGGAAARLSHRIGIDVARDGAERMRVAIAGGGFTPAAAYPAELGAPLRGGPWTAVSLPDHDNGHRRFPYAVSGQVAFPGRHAIDWMPALGFEPGSAGTGVAADGSGADVLAVADGEIVAVRERPAPGARPGVEDETGVMIVQRLADGRYAFYQHLEPGIAIRAGARVRRGEVIARVGSSGHVTRPHLHFHIADGITPLGSEGLPWRLGAGRIVGRYASYQAFSGRQAWQAEAERPVDGLPAANAVILFDRE